MNEIRDIHIERIPPARAGGHFRFRVLLKIGIPSETTTATVVVSAAELHSMNRFSRAFLEQAGGMLDLVPQFMGRKFIGCGLAGDPFDDERGDETGIDTTHGA